MSGKADKVGKLSNPKLRARKSGRTLLFSGALSGVLKKVVLENLEFVIEGLPGSGDCGNCLLSSPIKKQIEDLEKDLPLGPPTKHEYEYSEFLMALAGSGRSGLVCSLEGY